MENNGKQNEAICMVDKKGNKSQELNNFLVTRIFS